MEVFLSIILLSIIKHSVSMEEITVETKLGTIRGEAKTIKPFGNPLRMRQFLGDLRFKKPVIKRKMDGVYDTTRYRPSCLQLHIDLLGRKGNHQMVCRNFLMTALC